MATLEPARRAKSAVYNHAALEITMAKTPAAAVNSTPAPPAPTSSVTPPLPETYEAALSELERLPTQMLWGDIKLVVVKYPTAELTVTLYTLSLDKIWLQV